MHMNIYALRTLKLKGDRERGDRGTGGTGPSMACVAGRAGGGTIWVKKGPMEGRKPEEWGRDKNMLQ